MNNINNPILKFLFVLFIGVLVALFVGVGIDTFYESPKYPEYKCASPKGMPSEVRKEGPTQAELDEMNKCSEEMSRQSDEFSVKRKIYSRNVSSIAVIFAALIVAGSILFLGHILLIADGLLLGGIGTLIYSVVHSFSSDNNIFRFIIISIGLAIVITSGYFRFVHKGDKG